MEFVSKSLQLPSGYQVPLTVDGQTFYIDLLFYHVRLHRYFVFELLCGRPHNGSSVAQPVMWRRRLGQ
jgi:predicted nuclease of restriction endonuclease-like (RecB) superfamily